MCRGGRIAHHLLGVTPAVEQGDADARGQEHLGVANRERSCEQAFDAAGHRDGLGLAGQVGTDDRELVAHSRATVR